MLEHVFFCVAVSREGGYDYIMIQLALLAVYRSMGHLRRNFWKHMVQPRVVVEDYIYTVVVHEGRTAPLACILL